MRSLKVDVLLRSSSKYVFLVVLTTVKSKPSGTDIAKTRS